MRNNEWIAHDWRWARNVEGGPAPGANTVPTVQVNGALDRRYATPYGYGSGGGYGYGYGQQQAHPGWGWMRGGGEEDWFGKRVMMRVRGWTWKKELVFEEVFEGKPDDFEAAGGQIKPKPSRSTATDKPAFYRAPASRKESRLALFKGEVV